MTIDDTTTGEERLMQLARERQGFYQGQRGFYIGTADRGDDTILLNPQSKPYREELLAKERFGIYELGYEGMEVIDLAIIQLHDIIAGPFEDRQTALAVLSSVIQVRYLGK